MAMAFADIANAQSDATPLAPVVVQPRAQVQRKAAATQKAPNTARVIAARKARKTAAQRPVPLIQPAPAPPAVDPTASQPRDMDFSTGTSVQSLPLNQPSTAGSRLGLTPLQTPATVNIIPGELARDNDNNTIFAAISRAPGITLAPTPGNGNSFFVLRGFYGATAVEFLEDGVELRLAGNTAVFPFDPWTVDHIEVLNGPATTLYGTGSTGGAVNVISRKPDFTGQHGEIDLLAGSRNTFHEGLDLTGPITPNLAYRFDVIRRSTNGFVTNANSGSVDIFGALEYRPLQNLTIKLSQDYGDEHLAAYNGSVISNGQLVNALRNINYQVAGASIQNKVSFTNLREEWALSDAVLLRNYTYYANVQRPFFDSTVATYRPATQTVALTSFQGINNQPSPQFGNSGSLTFKDTLFGFKNETLIGFDVNQEYFNISDNRNAAGSFTGSVIAPAFNYMPISFAQSNTPTFRPHFHSNLSQYGVFLEDRIVFNDQLSFLTGTRFDQYSTTDEDYVANTVVTANPRDVTYHFGLVYEPIRNLSFFAQYATGADPYTSLGNVTLAQSKFSLTTGRETEVGVKEALFDGKLNATFSAYDIVKKNLTTPSATNPAVSVQVGEQSSKGLEASVSSIYKDLTFGANGTILLPKFDIFTSNGMNLAGYRPLLVPAHSANLWISYNFLPQWSVKSDIQYVGARFADNADTNLLPEYTVVGFGLRYAPTPKMFAEVRVDNAFNRTYVLNANQSAATQWILGDPRTVTGRVNYRF